MTCRQCGKRLGLLERWKEAHYCSRACQRQAEEENERFNSEALALLSGMRSGIGTSRNAGFQVPSPGLEEAEETPSLAEAGLLDVEPIAPLQAPAAPPPFPRPARAARVWAEMEAKALARSLNPALIRLETAIWARGVAIEWPEEMAGAYELAECWPVFGPEIRVRAKKPALEEACLTGLKPKPRDGSDDSGAWPGSGLLTQSLPRRASIPLARFAAQELRGGDEPGPLPATAGLRFSSLVEPFPFQSFGPANPSPRCAPSGLKPAGWGEGLVASSLEHDTRPATRPSASTQPAPEAGMAPPDRGLPATVSVLSLDRSWTPDYAPLRLEWPPRLALPLLRQGWRGPARYLRSSALAMMPAFCAGHRKRELDLAGQRALELGVARAEMPDRSRLGPAFAPAWTPNCAPLRREWPPRLALPFEPAWTPDYTPIRLESPPRLALPLLRQGTSGPARYRCAAAVAMMQAFSVGYRKHKLGFAEQRALELEVARAEMPDRSRLGPAFAPAWTPNYAPLRLEWPPRPASSFEPAWTPDYTPIRLESPPRPALPLPRHGMSGPARYLCAAAVAKMPAFCIGCRKHELSLAGQRALEIEAAQAEMPDLSRLGPAFKPERKRLLPASPALPRKAGFARRRGSVKLQVGLLEAGAEPAAQPAGGRRLAERWRRSVA